MIEAVGYEFWPTYFATLDRLLAPGGRVGLQAITMPHDRMLATRDTYTWIHKYIFPGGLIPSRDGDRGHHSRRHTGCGVTDRLSTSAPHYAETLRLWRDRFTARADEVARPRLRRDVPAGCGTSTWSYSEAGFALRLPRRAASSPWRRTDDPRPRPVTPPRPRRPTARTRAWPPPSPTLATQLGGDLPVRLRAWDGTEAGPGRRAHPWSLRSPLALRRLLWHPGELGLAQAYVTGELDVDGDLDEGLRQVWTPRRPAVGIRHS